VIVFAGIGFQILQLIVSIKQRATNLDTTGDPWNARTLEWSGPSPPPSYNFANLPVVSERDDWWQTKRSKSTPQNDSYSAITMPKNTIMPLLIASAAFGFGFGMIWHIYWLVILSALGIVSLIIIRTTDESHEYSISAAKVRQTEEELQGRFA